MIFARFLLLKLAGAVGSPGKALGEGEAGRIVFVSPAASPAVGNNSLPRRFPGGRAGQLPGLDSRPGGAAGRTWRDLRVPVGLTGDSLRESYCPNNSK